MAKTPIFAPLPFRAVGDQRLAGLHLRVLAAIASHDRLSRSRQAGKGCVASNSTLAREAGCEYSRLSATITELVKWGYVVKEPASEDKRLRTYRVLYEEPTADSLPDRKPSSLPNGKAPAADSLPNAPKVVCQPNPQPSDSKGEAPHNIFRETVIHSVETGKDSSVQTAPINIGGLLGQIERHLKAGGKIIEETVEWLIGMAEDYDDPNGNRARRILETYLPD